MRKNRIALACSAILLLSSGCSGGPEDSADTVYTNGRIYTVNEAQPWAEAVAIKDGKFLVVGSNADVDAVTGEGTEVVDLGGRFAMPGLHDVHDHGPEVADDGLRDEYIELPETLDPEVIVAAIAEFAAANPDLPAIRAGNYPFGMFLGDNGPKELLDRAAPGRPLYVYSQGGHALWVNSSALEFAGITAETEDPPFGIIARKPGGREPMGTLHESAMLLLLDKLPAPPPERLRRAAFAAARTLNSHGITSAKIAGVTQPVLEAMASADDAGDLPARYVAAFHWSTSFIVPKPPVEVIRPQILASSGFETEHVKSMAIKYYVDAAPASKTAAVLEPYEGDPDNYGLLNIEPEKLKEEMIFWDQNGVTAILHCIGDRAVRVALDAIEAAREANGDSGLRHHISHTLQITPEDMPRFAELGAVVDFSPHLQYPSPAHASHFEFFGRERVERWWPFADMKEAGALIAIASDFPVSPYDPWSAIEAHHTRANPWGAEEGTLGGNQAAGLPTVLRAFTINPAYILGQENETGSIEEGKFADFIVLDRNLLEIEAEDISETKVEKTVFEGRVVYQAR